ncbi:acetate CoA-transferase subunit alpha [Oceanobacillus senegalensis]|uniref:acetate CoA-transferase subunit alpha n=1 Tax=Oceanobacillus senegalensis TaxID=1936063 RepID=UPI000A308128|nr:acetate CoA-transferase subunit alpha [Oceanobacillus senegalensis]
MNKVITMKDAINTFKDSMTIMCGGFMGVGASEKLVSAILESNAKDLTLISSDTAYEETGVGPLVANNRIKRLIASHIGTNPMTGKKMIAGEIDVELVPQGTLAERLHAGGAGLGGVLTPTGVGTVVEEGKATIEVDGKVYLLEKPLKADVAIIKAHKADKAGNLVYHQSARNFNPMMALAADLVVVEVEEIVEIGELDPNTVVTPGVVVDKILV